MRAKWLITLALVISAVPVSAFAMPTWLATLLGTTEPKAQDAETKQTPETAQNIAKILFRRLTGVPISSSDPRLSQMTDLIQAGQIREAAAIATNDSNFYQVTVKNLAAEISSRSETPYIGLDDFQATFIGTVLDGLDARLLLTGNFLYRAKRDLVTTDPSRRNNTHYEQIDQGHLEYKSSLVKQEPQWTGSEAMRNHAGVMTTRGWGWNYDAGTNRRAVQYAFDRFLCKPIAAWKVPAMDESYIGRDVDRSPGKNPKVFQEQCRTCHGGLDPMRDAFSSMDFLSSALIELPPFRPAPKYKRGSATYPEGHVTRDDTWMNPIVSYRPELGFKPEQASGQGVQAFGEMIANASAFNSCMAQRVFDSVCQRAAGPKDSTLIDRLAFDFDQNGHNLKKLFEEIAASSTCLETAGVKTFRGIYYSLSVALGVQPTKEIDDYYQSNMTRLPKDGRIDEVSASMLLAQKGLASLYCREFAKNNPALAKGSPETLIADLSQRIYGRELTQAEGARISNVLSGSRRDQAFIACTVMASSLEFLVQ